MTGCFAYLVMLASLLLIPASAQSLATPVRPAEPAPITLEFTAPGQPTVLNPALVWYPGESRRNRYDILVNPGKLTLIAGPADKYGSTICHAVSGDFRAQAYLNIMPVASGQGSGVFIRPVGTWERYVAVVRHNDGDIQKMSVWTRSSSAVLEGEDIEYLAAGAEVRIERRRRTWTVWYKDGFLKEWKTLRESFSLTLPEAVEVCLNTWSTNAIRGITGTFGDFSITPVSHESVEN